jgi:hypothetical protein
MTTQTIEIRRYRDIESIKIIILKKLNLVDYKKDCVAEFDIRLSNFINRHQNLTITFLINRNAIEKDLKFNLMLSNRSQQKFPDNYEIGNPYNRWLYDPVIKSEDQEKQESLRSEKSFDNQIAILNSFLHSLERLGNGKIIVRG